EAGRVRSLASGPRAGPLQPLGRRAGRGPEAVRLRPQDPEQGPAFGDRRGDAAEAEGDGRQGREEQVAAPRSARDSSMGRHRRLVRIVAAAAGLVLAGASPSLAQAWLPPKGEGWFSLNYSNLYSNRHFFASGPAIGGSQISANTYLATLGYSVTDRLGFA